MSVSNQELLNHLGRLSFIDAEELRMNLGKTLGTIHQGKAGVLSEGVVGCVSHSAPHIASLRKCRRYSLSMGIIQTPF